MRKREETTFKPVDAPFGIRPKKEAIRLAPTSGAPHIRDSFNQRRAMKYMLVALTPCIAMAFVNTGFQANVHIVEAGLDKTPGWRGFILESLQLGHDPSNLLSIIIHGALYFLPILIVAMGIGALWEYIFSTLRNRRFMGEFLMVSLLFTLVLPPSIPLWQVALGITFAIVIGREIFGGTGMYFLNPPLVGIAFLYVTFPREMAGETAWTVIDAFTTATYLETAGREGAGTILWMGTSWVQAFFGFLPGPIGATSTLACIVGAIFLLWTRLVSARIVVGILLGMISMVLLINRFGDPSNSFVGLTWYWHLVLGSFAFGTIFLATDPVSSAMTDTGRLIYGILIGFMVVIIRVANTSHPDGVMYAILFGNVFAPLIDHLVVRAHIYQRARRDG